MDELTYKEKMFLKILFQIGYRIIDGCGGAYDLDGESEYFNKNDLFDLAEKYGLAYKIY